MMGGKERDQDKKKKLPLNLKTLWTQRGKGHKKGQLLEKGVEKLSHKNERVICNTVTVEPVFTRPSCRKPVPLFVITHARWH